MDDLRLSFDEMNRYRLNNSDKLIEFPHTEEGLKKAKEYRKTHPEFKRKQIRQILQLLPEKIEFEKEYFFT